MFPREPLQPVIEALVALRKNNTQQHSRTNRSHFTLDASLVQADYPTGFKVATEPDA